MKFENKHNTSLHIENCQLINISISNEDTYLKQNSIGEKISFITSNDVYIGEIFSCSSLTTKANTALLLYDIMFKNTSGNIETKIENSKLTIIGHDTKFTQEVSSGDYVIIESDNGSTIERHVVKDVINDNKIITGSSSTRISTGYLFITNGLSDSVESLIYESYNKTTDSVMQNKVKNIMPIRPNRRIFCKFEAEEVITKNIRNNEISGVSVAGKSIYKLYINGELLENSDYAIVGDKIRISATEKVKAFNNYCYIIMYSNAPSQSSAILGYYGYKNTHSDVIAYIDSLSKLQYYTNFNDSLSYGFHEYSSESSGVTNKIKTGKRHTININSNIASTYGESITNDIRSFITNLTNFRIIKFNADTYSITIYNKCELNNPESESIGDDVNTVTYSIDFRDKILIQPENKISEFDMNKIKVIGVW